MNIFLLAGNGQVSRHQPHDRNKIYISICDGKLNGIALFSKCTFFPDKIEHENFKDLLHDVTDDHLIQGKFPSGHAFRNPNYATDNPPTPAGRNTSNYMHDMIQRDALIQRRGTLWNVSESKQCKHYQKLTPSYHFGGYDYVLPGILDP